MTTSTHAVRRRVAQVMGLPVSLALRGRHTDDNRADDAWAAVMATLHDIDRAFSTYRDDSVISRLSRGEAAEVPAEVAEVLAIGERARIESGGSFDIVRAGVLDPSGVVKGWAVERASSSLRSLADTDFCLSAGGDMVVSVADPERAAWRVGIEHAADPTRIRAAVPVRTGAIATSGLAHRGAHVVDARSGAVPIALASVTVVGPDLTWADIDATAGLALDREAPGWLATRPGRTAYLQWSDGRTQTVVGQAGCPAD